MGITLFFIVAGVFFLALCVALFRDLLHKFILHLLERSRLREHIEREGGKVESLPWSALFAPEWINDENFRFQCFFVTYTDRGGIRRDAICKLNPLYPVSLTEVTVQPQATQTMAQSLLSWRYGEAFSGESWPPEPGALRWRPSLPELWNSPFLKTGLIAAFLALLLIIGATLLVRRTGWPYPRSLAPSSAAPTRIKPEAEPRQTRPDVWPPREGGKKTPRGTTGF